MTTVVQFFALTEKRLLEWRHKFAALSKKRLGHQQLCSDVSGQQGCLHEAPQFAALSKKMMLEWTSTTMFADSENLSTRKA